MALSDSLTKTTHFGQSGVVHKWLLKKLLNKYLNDFIEANPLMFPEQEKDKRKVSYPIALDTGEYEILIDNIRKK